MAERGWCSTCAAFYGDGSTGNKSDHAKHYVAVDKRGRYMATGFDGRKSYCWWLDEIGSADKIASHNYAWHRRQGRTLVPLPDEMERRDRPTKVTARSRRLRLVPEHGVVSGRDAADR